MKKRKKSNDNRCIRCDALGIKGRKSDVLYEIMIDGNILWLCDKCYKEYTDEVEFLNSIFQDFEDYDEDFEDYDER